MSEPCDSCEPSAEMVAALRATFADLGRPIGAGIAQIALTVALKVQHEQAENNFHRLSEGRAA